MYRLYKRNELAFALLWIAVYCAVTMSLRGQFGDESIYLLLEPIFIFWLHMGVVGAGIATVIGEVAAGTLCLLYLRRLQTVRLTKAALRPTRGLTLRILKLGFPSLLTQVLTALVQIVLNNLMRIAMAWAEFRGWKKRGWLAE